MIDAATIGITLALQDGVSTGIAAIARDLAALDRATGTAATNLTRLAALADTLRAGPLARLTDTTVRAATIAMPQSGATPAATATATATLAEAAATAAPGIAPNAPAPSSPAAAPRTATPQTAAIQTAPIPPSPTAPPFAAFAPANLPGPPSAPDAAAVFAPANTDAPRIAAAPPAASATPFMPSATGETAPSPTRAANAPRAPIAALTSPVTATSEPATAATAAPANSADNTQPEGRLVLEGFELGRWMSDRLNREATRPPAGATGFDPRPVTRLARPVIRLLSAR